MFTRKDPTANWISAMERAGYGRARHAGGFHCSQLLNPCGDRNAAEVAYRELLSVLPNDKRGLEGLAYLLQLQGRTSEAIVFRRRLIQGRVTALGIEPQLQAETVEYLLAAETGASPQARAPQAYVKNLFDQYAKSFDVHLLEQLNYCGPALLRNLIDEVLGEGTTALAVLDIGCGTGLAGAALQSLANRLDGIDLSPKMLAVARERGIYDHLYQGEVIEVMREYPGRYDIVVAADVLNYFGDLQSVFKAVHGTLQDAGYFVFTVEKGDQLGFRLRSTGRYQHEVKYVRHCARTAGFTSVSCKETALREQDGAAVMSHIVALQRLPGTR